MTQENRQQLLILLRLIYGLQAETWTNEKITKPEAFAEVIKQAQVLGIALEPTDPQFLPTMAVKIYEELRKPPEQPVPNIDSSQLKEWGKDLQQAKEDQKIKTTKLLFPISLDEQIKNALRINQQKIAKILISQEPRLAQFPEIAEEISWKSTVENINNLPVSRPEAFSEKEYEKIINEKILPAVTQELKKWGIEKTKIEANKEILAKELTAQTYQSAKTLAATPHNTLLQKETTKPPLSKEIPTSILSKLEGSTDGVAFSPIFTALHPPTAISFTKKIVFAPIVKALQGITNNSEQIIPRAQLAILKGLTSKDLQLSLEVLEKLGLPSNHPQIDILKNQFDYLEEFESSHKVLTFILKNYYEYSKKIEKWQIQEPESELYLPSLSPKPAWHRLKGYSWNLRQGLNKFGFFIKTHEKTYLGPGKSIIRFILPDKATNILTFGKVKKFANFRTIIYQKTVKPVFIWLGKTAVGRAVKTGFKQVANWVALKLGIKIAASVTTAGVGTVIAFWPEIKKLIKKAGAFVGGLLIVAAHYGAAALTGTLIGALGGLIGGAVLGFKIGAAIGFIGGPLGAIIGGIIGTVVFGIGGFLIGLGIQLLIDKIHLAGASLPQATAVATSKATAAAVTSSGNIVLGTIGGIAVAGAIITQINSSAFLGPEGKPLTSPYIQTEKNASFSGKIGEVIEYKIIIKPTDKPLQQLKIKDRQGAICEGQTPILNSQMWEEQEIQLGNSWEKSYSVKTNESFNNCLISNTVEVTALVDGQTEKSFAEANIVIGQPPMDCPSGWPTDFGHITQGPAGTFSHHNPNIQEAIDIGIPVGNKVYATHKGTTFVSYDPLEWKDVDKDGKKECVGGGGYYVKISGVCRGIPFSSWYFHLNQQLVPSGTTVKLHDLIGLSGSTGTCKFSPHLHYEFREHDRYEATIIKMIRPFVPIDVPRGCGESFPCNIQW
jgi:murein DD-endopeptidase MepM/ murein hydrolase activator NlpD